MAHVNQREKIVQILSVNRPIKAVLVEDDGSFTREPVDLVGLDNTGDVFYLSADEYGNFDRLDRLSNFLRFERY